MNLYKIEENLKPHDISELENYTGESVIIMSGKEIQKKINSNEIPKNCVPKYKNVDFSKATVYTECLSATFSILSKDKQLNKVNFGFILVKNKLIFIDDNNTVESYIRKIYKDKYHGKINIGRFLYDFLEIIIESDLRYLEELANRLTKIESAVVRGIFDEFNKFMFKFKKETLAFYRYYTQLSDLSDELQENENGFFSNTDIDYFRKFSKRVDKLREETKFLRENSNQLRDVYHSAVDVKNNKVMKVLTVVTTLFTPMTISASWYGMNFTTMPELSHPLGYIGFIVINIVVLIICYFILKKHHFL